MIKDPACRTPWAAGHVGQEGINSTLPIGLQREGDSRQMALGTETSLGGGCSGKKVIPGASPEALEA